MNCNASDHRSNKYIINIDDFKALHQVKYGGFGVVYSCQNKLTNEKFAAKVLVNHDDEINYEKMVNREIGILIRCQNPTVIKFYGYSLKDFNKQNNVTIFMDFAEKGSLAEQLYKVKQFMADPNYDDTVKQIILCGIAYGMMYLHRRHIIHRDLKPGNVLLDQKLHPHITDFGLSKIYDRFNSKQSQQCGTSIYMAPEVIRGLKYNEKVDVYSFGILMYEIVTDQSPYPLFENGRLSPKQFENKITQENYRPEFNVSVKSSIKKLIQKCWADDPKERPSFEIIFNMLAYNIEDPNDENFYKNDDDENDDADEKKYYLDGADADDVIEYVEDIDQSQNDIFSSELLRMKKIFDDKINSITEENDKMKNQLSGIKTENEQIKKQLIQMENILKGIGLEKLSVKLFNSLPLQYKLSLISNLSNARLKTYFTKIKNLLSFFDKLKQDPSYTYLEIVTDNQEQSLNDIQIEEQVRINSNVTEMLHLYKSFNSSDFTTLLNQFTNILFEIKYPSEYYKDIYQEVLQIKKNMPKKMHIGIFITHLNKGECEFNGNNEINSVRLHSTIEQIIGKNGLFKSCRGLAQVTIPSSVKLIGNSSFDECLSIKHIIIPLSVKSINECAFKCCKSLETIDIPPSVIDIGEGCFAYCIKLTKISIPYSIKVIKHSTFYACASLKQVDLTKSLVKIDDYAFDNCDALENIKIPVGISMGKNVFSKKTKITTFK